MPAAFIVFISTGLLVYWFERTMLLLNGSNEEIDQTLKTDLWWGRKLLLQLRTIFGSPTSLAV
jgi:hypothetical protein